MFNNFVINGIADFSNIFLLIFLIASFRSFLLIISCFLVSHHPWSHIATSSIDDLSKEDQKRYKYAESIKNGYVRGDEVICEEPIIVCMDGEEILISEDEASVLALGPKFCVMADLSEELFEAEIEECIMKYRWELMGEEEHKTRKKSKSDVAFEVVLSELFSEEEKSKFEEEQELQEAESRMVYRPQEGIFDLSRRRTTDLKGNSRVIFPRKASSFEVESKLEALRVEARAEFRKFMAQKCNKGGKQKSNLTRGQERGLKSLRKRVKDAELVILPTDKSGNFSVMTRGTYEKAGLKHVGGDVPVGNDELWEGQKEINGHVAMLVKCFKIGQNWNHTDRIRETMMGEGMATCPVSLLYKDHKGWTREMGTVPPTRNVAGGHRGMNLYLSEIISDILEPIVETLAGGEEVISTEDLLARIDKLNMEMVKWSPYTWWEGKTVENYVACGECGGNDETNWDMSTPELCDCGRTDIPEDGMVRTTVRWVRTLRRLRWEEDVEWDENDEERTFYSHEMLPEDRQDYMSPMVLVGSDVVSLYPNLDVARVSKMMGEAVRLSPLKWEGVDWMECARYVALNLTNEECRSSKLRRILPWRRKTGGTRPGIKGKNPRGKHRGDTEQWCFPDVILEKWEQRELLATVVEIATHAMFKTHFYDFAGQAYHQKSGGPIGLRGTCAVARVAMQLFDIRWKEKLSRMGIDTWLLARYMDDARAFLPPLKHGWRVGTDGLQFKLGWKLEDKDLSPTQVTARALAGSMEGVEKFLKFTIETCEDTGFFGWLPTLDTCLRVEPNNTINYKFYEKPVSSKRTVQDKTAMNTNSKLQILSQDLVRRLLNTREELGAIVRSTVVDNYAAKLGASGFKTEQIKKILINGIKGYETKRRSRKMMGRSFRNTTRERA